jgi:quercetin dioxygenase-like cupin family protein
MFDGIPFLCRPLPNPANDKMMYFLWLPVGASFPIHKHSEEEIVRVTKGKVAIGEQVLDEGESIRIPANTMTSTYALANSILLIRRPRDIVYRKPH